MMSGFGADSVSKKSRFSRTFSKIVNIPNISKTKLHDYNQRNGDDSHFGIHLQQQPLVKRAEMKSRVSIVRAFIAKMFAEVSSIKAAYAELQLAQFPYNSSAIKTADDAIVAELRELSEMKRGFVKKEIDLSPQVTLLLAEVQEQQSLMKTYEIMLKKLETESNLKDVEIELMKSELNTTSLSVKSMETTLNSSGALLILQGVELQDLNFKHFSEALFYALRCVRSFVKLLVMEMEQANWDLSSATRAIVPEAGFIKHSHRIYTFESFVNKVMFAGFNGDWDQPMKSRHVSYEEFKKLGSLNPKHHLSQNPNSQFGKFLRSKYVNLVHPKMECSLFGNLNQRSTVCSGQLPGSEFFTAFAEMTKRVWLLNLLAMSFSSQVSAFQVVIGSRFSEVYMENVTENDTQLPVGFTVAPGFRVGGTVVKCSVYLSPPPPGGQTC